jgi:DNA repair protein RadC
MAQAKTLSDKQLRTLLATLATGRHKARHRANVLTSFRAGMRAAELAPSRIDGAFVPNGTLSTSTSDDNLIAQALAILARRIYAKDTLAAPGAVRDYLRLLLAGREHEVFVAVLLDAQNRVLSCQELFRGTLTQTSVYPREVVKVALAANAGAVIFAHNHPSGCSEPSRADELLTQQLKSALALVDIKVLDHFVVAGGESLSFAERGLL